jgi:hypothetical protein
MAHQNPSDQELTRRRSGHDRRQGAVAAERDSSEDAAARAAKGGLSGCLIIWLI